MFSPNFYVKVKSTYMRYRAFMYLKILYSKAENNEVAFMERVSVNFMKKTDKVNEIHPTVSQYELFQQH